jgi:hypothetical protein
MDSITIALRAQDFHEGLRHVGTFGPKDVYYSKTLIIGKAATLAMHLRGLLYINDFMQLQYAASSLGIGQELPLVLHELEEVDFLSIVRTGEEIKRIDLKIPEFRDGYNDLGERWKLLKPTEVEEASIKALDRLYRGSVPKEALLKEFKIDKETILIDVMGSGHLLSVQAVDGQPIAFTPLAVDGNPTEYLAWSSKFPDDIPSVVSTLQTSQGLSIDDPRIARVAAIQAAISTGVLMPVQVQGSTGLRSFIFAPQGGLSREQRVILDKGRAIVSCVRYGQNYAASRKILYPRRILEILKENKKFKKGHPDLFDQYGLLVEKLIGHPVQEGNGNWNFHIDDTDENMKALQVAIEMIEHGATPSAHLEPEAEKELLSPTSYLSPVSTRPKILNEAQVSKQTRTEIIRQMANLARGISAR